MKKPFKILCIDGGGIKGLFSAEILSVFEKTYNTNCSDHFDLICGTSTGGIIALAISLKIPMTEVVSFYKEYGPSIFNQKKKWWPIKNTLLSIKQAILTSKYRQDELRKALTEKFGDKIIKESNNLLCIPAFNMIDGKPRIFKKDYGTLNQDNEKTYVEVALATCAAPTYLPLAKINNTIYADGGLFANNPTLIGLSEALFKWIKPISERNDESYDGVKILSISSLEKAIGEVPGKMSKSFLNWKDTLFDTYIVGQNKSTEFFLDKVKSHLDFELEITRIKNKSLSDKQSSISSLDNASDKFINLLSSMGENTGLDYKDKKEIKDFFTENKTVSI